MLSSGIKFINYKDKKKNTIVKKKLESLIKEDNEILKSLSKNYKNNFEFKKLNKFKKFSNFRIIGMGGSTLGSQAIYDFLNKKIRKKFYFVDNLQVKKKNFEKKKLQI